MRVSRPSPGIVVPTAVTRYYPSLDPAYAANMNQGQVTDVASDIVAPIS